MKPFLSWSTGTLLVFLAAMLWATDAPFRVQLLTQVSPSFLVLGEHFFDCLLLLPLLGVFFKQLRTLTPKEWMALLLISVGGSALATLAFTAAFAYMNPSVVILLQKLQPFIAIVAARLMLNEVPAPRFWVWALVAICGAYLLSFPHFVPRLFEGETFNPNLKGVFLALFAAVLWGLSTVLGKYALRRLDFSFVTASRFFFAFVFLLIWNTYFGHLSDVFRLTTQGWLFLLIVACVSGVMSLWIYYRGLRTTDASVATIAELGYPLAAVMLNFFFLGDTLSPVQIVGMIILLVAVVILARGDGRVLPKKFA